MARCCCSALTVPQCLHWNPQPSLVPERSASLDSTFNLIFHLPTKIGSTCVHLRSKTQSLTHRLVLPKQIYNRLDIWTNCLPLQPIRMQDTPPGEEYQNVWWSSPSSHMPNITSHKWPCTSFPAANGSFQHQDVTTSFPVSLPACVHAVMWRPNVFLNPSVLTRTTIRDTVTQSELGYLASVI